MSSPQHPEQAAPPRDGPQAPPPQPPSGSPHCHSTSRLLLVALLSLLIGATFAAATTTSVLATRQAEQWNAGQQVRDVERTMLSEEIAKRTRAEERLRDCDEQLSIAREALAHASTLHALRGANGHGADAGSTTGCDCAAGDQACRARCGAR